MGKQFLYSAAAVAIAVSLSGPAAAADFRMPAKAPPVLAPECMWCGLYVGAHAGYGWSKHSAVTSETFDEGDPLDGPRKLSGLALGLQGGYNWQVSQWVFGIEADASMAPWRQTLSGNSAQTIHRSVDWLASVRGRLGWAFDRSLIYATGGVAWSGAQTTRLTGSIGGAVNFQNNPGYVVGAGYEFKYSPNLSIRLEGLYYGFNVTRSGGPDIPAQITETFKDVSVVRVGFNWHPSP
jgi:outer membrane immunogenic protein